MNGETNKSLSPIGKVLWGIFCVAVFGPFALLFGFAFLGIGIGDMPGFGAWFMLALTACGAITFVTLIVDGIRNRRMEWILILIAGGATYWWAKIAIKPFL